jgi:hypothetical protein
MASEPSVLPDVLDGLPDEADYDTVCAALMATERGRRFLAEYAERNRHADTQTLVAAIARVEAAVRGDPVPEPILVSSGDLAEIATAIDRIEAEITAAQSGDMATLIERIQDIAFVLHERPIEATLCDALDGAIREIASTNMAAESMHRATELLRALSRRVKDMMPPAPAEGAVDVSPAAPTSIADLAKADHKTLAQAVADFAATLPALAEIPRPVSVESAPAGEAAAPAEAAPGANVTAPPDGAGQGADQISPPDSSETILDQAFESDTFVRSENLPEDSPRSTEARVGAPVEILSSAELPSGGLLPKQDYLREAVAGPEEDPADLFEPLPVPTPVTAPAVAVTAPQSLPMPPRVAPALRGAPRPAVNDPLAAVRALSEEELQALFS